ncbi:MAG: exo-alpha-sialidase [bacterium]|nr:exo-alpha-sialidase [bacterium]
MTRRSLALVLSLLAFAAVAQSQEIFQYKGVDSRVDYSSLTEIGPWDDRNYQLTQKDLSLLAANEKELKAQIPAFFRVELRRGIPEMQKTGPVQYPRSALQIFRLMYGGYLVDGKIYSRATIENGVYRVLTEKGGVDEKEFWQQKFLSGEVRVTDPNGAAESAIKINPVNTDLVIAGSNGPGSGQIMHYSTDGGENWSTSAALPLGGTCCDPTVDWSSDGTLAYTATLGSCGGSGCQIWFYRSSDGGQTWTDLPGSRVTLSAGNANDKEYIHVDKYATSPHKDNIYATWHSSNILQFAASSDNGETWSTMPHSSATDQRGIGSDITTDKSGAVYHFWPAFNSQRILLRKSTDGGATLGSVIEVSPTEGSFAFPVPSMETREVFIYVSADTDFSNGPFGDSIYAAWSDSTGPTGAASSNHARIQVAYSRNGGNTWTVTTPHETADANSVDRYHQWLTVGEDGTVHVIFYDTRRSGSRTAVDIFYSSSTDGAQTWSTPTRITAQQSPNIGDSFEFGDYNGMDIVMQDMVAIYTDNRNEGGGGGDSVDVYAAGIPVTGGCSPQPIADAGADVTIEEGQSTTIGTATQAGHTYSWSPGGATTAQVNVSPTSTTVYTVTATTSCGSAQDSVTVTVIPAGGGGPQNAVFNGTYQAPACLNVGSSCDTNALVDGRANLGPESNQPNTINDSCADGTSGGYHSDESNDRIVVRTLDSGNFTEGDTVEIEATVWAWTTPSADTLDLYFAADANSPSWTLITSITPPAAGANTLTAQYTLPTGSLQAVRAQFRYQSTNAECASGAYNDRDDLVFAVEPDACTSNAQCDNGQFCDGAETCNPGTGQCESGTAPTCGDGIGCTVDSCNEGTDSCDNVPNNSLCDNGLFCDGAETCSATLDCQSGSAPNCNDGVGCTVDSCNEGTDSCDNLADDAACDDGLFCNGAETCNATLDCQAGSDPCSGGQTCNETTDICEGGGGCPSCIDWTTTPTVSYSTQDVSANVTVESADSILLQDNTWRRTTQTFNVTANTVIELDFQSTSQGEIHGIGFDEDDGLSSDRIFKVHGTQNWGITDFDNYSGSSLVHYTIPVGQYFTGSAMFLVLVNDNDAGSGNDSRFQNVEVYEDVPVGCSTDDDFEGGAAGWTTSGTCTTGTFVLGTPTQQTSTVVTQVGGDHTTGSGSALFTATNSSAGNADVDGGECALTSPVYNVTDASDLSIWYFHGQRDTGDDAAGDYFVLEASVGGGGYSPFVSIGDVQTVASWTNAATSVPAGSTVQLRVRVSDGAGPGDIVEGGIDDLSICPQ